MEISQIIIQDLNAVLLAAKDDDYRLMNIYSNRVMMNATFGKSSNFAVIGFFIKEIAKICSSIKNNKKTTSYSTAKSIALNYIESMDINDGNEKLWNNYTQFYNKIRKYQEDEYERQSYQDNSDFTSMSFDWLLKLAKTEKDLIFNPANRLIAAIANEMDRIIRVHGGGLSENCLVSLFKALTLSSSYLFFNESEKQKNIAENTIFPYIDLIATLEPDKIDLDQVTNILANIIFDWRISYIKFLERTSFVPVEEQKAEITAETRKKLSESIEKALEEEVK